MFEPCCGFQCILGRKKTRDAFDQAMELFDIEIFKAAKVIQDFGNGKSFFRIAHIMGKLDIGSDRAVFVFA